MRAGLMFKDHEELIIAFLLQVKYLSLTACWTLLLAASLALFLAESVGFSLSSALGGSIAQASLLTMHISFFKPPGKFACT